MTKRVNLELDLPDDVAGELRNEGLTAKVKESLVVLPPRSRREHFGALNTVRTAAGAGGPRQIQLAVKFYF